MFGEFVRQGIDLDLQCVKLPWIDRHDYLPMVCGSLVYQIRGDPQPYTSLTCLSGRLRTGLPVAAKIALSTAGVTTQIVGSPTPPQKSPDGTITVSTVGISASLRI